VLGQVMAEFPDKVRLVFKDFPLSFHAGALPAAVAARCAGEHGRYWEYHDLLFVAQPAFSKTDLLGYAARLGLPAEPFAACLESARHRDAVLADFAEGRAGGVQGTPTFFVNGRRLVGAQRLQAFQKAVQDALADAAGKQP
jgi:protein-disulfide isomerase